MVITSLVSPLSNITKADEKYLLTAGEHQYFVKVWHYENVTSIAVENA